MIISDIFMRNVAIII